MLSKCMDMFHTNKSSAQCKSWMMCTVKQMTIIGQCRCTDSAPETATGSMWKSKICRSANIKCAGQRTACQSRPRIQRGQSPPASLLDYSSPSCLTAPSTAFTAPHAASEPPVRTNTYKQSFLPLMSLRWIQRGSSHDITFLFFTSTSGSFFQQLRVRLSVFLSSIFPITFYYLDILLGYF